MSNFKVKAIFLHQTDRMGHLGSILEIQKFWHEYLIILDIRKYNLLSDQVDQILKWKSFYIKQTGWGHLESFLDNRIVLTWISNYFRPFISGANFEVKAIIYIKQTE